MSDPCKEGDRIKLVSMPDDPNPIPAGTLGTVTFVCYVPLGAEDCFWQIGVDWDNGRSLMVCTPPDAIVKI